MPITIGAGPMQLDQYVLPLKRRNAANWVRLEVRADDQGLPGETILEQIDIHDYPLDIPFVDDRPAPVVITSPTRPTIAAGAKIWIVMTAPEGLPFGDNSWGLVSIVNSNLVMAQRDTINTNYLWEAGVPIAYYPALRVTATPVPEPTTCLLLAAGGIGWASVRRLNRLRRIHTP